MERAAGILDGFGDIRPGWLRHREGTARRRAREARSSPDRGRRYPSSPDGLGIPVSMIPTLGDDERLRDVLLAAKRAHQRGSGPVDDQILHVAPLIEALDTARRHRRDTRDLIHQLLGTIREIPIMPHDPMMGSEPLAYRWVVSKPAEFDRVIMRLRAEFPVSL